MVMLEISLSMSSQEGAACMMSMCRNMFVSIMPGAVACSVLMLLVMWSGGQDPQHAAEEGV